MLDSRLVARLDVDDAEEVGSRIKRQELDRLSGVVGLDTVELGGPAHDLVRNCLALSRPAIYPRRHDVTRCACTLPDRFRRCRVGDPAGDR
ncbi:hypothetical protein [Streptomyces sp. NPDC006274]|uniref:hypothetical protein n=1 Tax=unclassified Streptomyces TaxID=2593676 RepID=UPI0033AD9B94